MSNYPDSSVSEIQKKFYGYIAYLFSSAVGLITEPGAYGPIRLLCAVENLLMLLDETGLADDDMKVLLKSIVEDKGVLISDESKLKAFLEDTSVSLAARLV